MFKNIKAVYGYGFTNYRFLSAVRGSHHIGGIPVIHAEEFHPDGVMLVYKEAALNFYRLYGRQLRPAPTNVIHYPGPIQEIDSLPRVKYYQEAAFGVVFKRWQYSPFESFAEDLRELDEIMGTDEYRSAVRRWRRQLPGIHRREQARIKRWEHVLNLRRQLISMGDPLIYHSRKRGDIQATLFRKWSAYNNPKIALWIRQSAAPHLVYRVNPELVEAIPKSKL